MYDAARKYKGDELDTLIPPEYSEFAEVFQGTNKLLRITTTQPGGKVIKHLIVRSFHPIFGEEKTMQHRINTIDAYLGTISYTCAGGIVTKEYAEIEARVMQTFLMECEGFDGDISNGDADGSFRYARLHAVSAGQCVGSSPENVRSVATGVLKIGYLETLDIYSQLDNDELFGLLLDAHGIKDGVNNPMNESFQCPGVMEGCGKQARPCPLQGCDREDMPCVYVVGTKTKDWAMSFSFGCDTCSKAICRRELEVIGKRIEAEEKGNKDVVVTETQRMRYKKREESRIKSNAKERETTKLMKQNVRNLSTNQKARVEKRKQSNAKINAKSKEDTSLKKREEEGEKLKSPEKKRVEKRKKKNQRNAERMNKIRKVEDRTKKRGKWTKEEDAVVEESVKAGNSWKVIADKLPGRTNDQVRQRWTEVIDPKLDKGPFKDADDLRLWNAYNEIGGKWVDISKEKFDGRRSANHVKNRFNRPGFKEIIDDKFGNGTYDKVKAAKTKKK